MFTVRQLIEASSADLVQGDVQKRIKSICIDSRRANPGDCFIAIKGSSFDGHDFIAQAIKNGASCVIVSISNPKLLSSNPKYKRISILNVDDTIRALGKIAALHRQRFSIPVIAVTGSNGKTTTKEMLAHVLSARMRVLRTEGTKNNNIGVPLTLLNLKSTHDIAVVELGTNHFGEIEYLSGICRPNMAVITNIAASHLEFLRDLNGVFTEKTSLLRLLQKPAIAILNADDKFLYKLISGRKHRHTAVSFGVRSRADFRGSAIELRGEESRFLLNFKHRFMLKNCGQHNIHNALSAIAVARIFGLSHKDIISKLASFKFPAGRCSMAKFGGLRLIDDTYNSNPFSLEHALYALANIKVKGRRIFVMGDMLELGPDRESLHCKAGRLAAKICDTLIAVGPLSGKALREAKKSGMKEKDLFSCADSGQAGKILIGKIQPCSQDAVLVKGSRAMKMEEIINNLKQK